MPHRNHSAKPFIYLACPLAHPSAVVRNDRTEHASLAAAMLMDAGFAVFSPLSHAQSVSRHLVGEREHDWWMQQDLRILHACDHLFVLPIAGWRTSKGVAMEIEYYRRHNRRIQIIQHMPYGHFHNLELLDPEELDMMNWAAWRPEAKEAVK